MKSRSNKKSEAAFAKAQKLMPGGVSSPVRAFKAVGGTPLFIASASGCRITDIDGNSYIDYVGSYGPLIAGHANDRVVAALSKAIGKGWSYGAPSELETRLATMIASAFPSIEMVRFVNSGTEAVMSALRLARAATGRNLIVKCIGCYHGHADGLLVEAGSGALTLGTPSSPGIPASITNNTLTLHYNDLEAATALFAKYPQKIACFIVEGVPGNMGVILPKPGYLEGLRNLCDKNSTLLVIDEVMSGFRVDWGGAQTLYNINADITCLGKIIGGGMPVGAYAGSRKLMELISPAGKVYQAGTLSGNPLAMTAGLATLEIINEKGAFDTLEATSLTLEAGLHAAARAADVPLTINRRGSMLTPFFTRSKNSPVTSYTDAVGCDTEAYARFFHAMLDNGVYLPPSQFEAWFVGLAHDKDAIESTLAAAQKAFCAMG